MKLPAANSAVTFTCTLQQLAHCANNETQILAADLTVNTSVWEHVCSSEKGSRVTVGEGLAAVPVPPAVGSVVHRAGPERSFTDSTLNTAV